MNKIELIEKIKTLIEDAEKEYDESSEDRDSHAHGYDVARLTTLKEVLELLEELNA
jgi:hypothetical protein